MCCYYLHRSHTSSVKLGRLLLARSSSTSLQLHRVCKWKILVLWAITNLAGSCRTVCPSGLRGWTQVPLARAARAQIPQLSFCADSPLSLMPIWTCLPAQFCDAGESLVHVFLKHVSKAAWRKGGMAQWQRVGPQIRRLGARISLLSSFRQTADSTILWNRVAAQPCDAIRI